MEVKKMAVLGSGTMGSGIAQAAITGGLDVCLYDISQDFLDKAAAGIRGRLEKRVEKGKMSREECDAVLARLRTSMSLEDAVKDVDFVIEAVPEDLELKKKMFADLDRLCPSHTILGTNTSSLPVTAIAAVTNRSDKVVGTHFFNPAAVMQLLEVVIPIGAAEETIETTCAVARQMGKVPVKAKDTPGFIVNRLLGLFYMEAAQMVLEGTATAEDIDTAMKLGCGHPMGPCELADFGGFDVIAMSSDEMFKYTQGQSRPLNLLYRKMIEAGRLGRKNGKGFYDYLPDGSKKPFKLF